ncbi:hypothetical protein HispidOSU_006357, partial [Sigmodon hispidus]
SAGPPHRNDPTAAPGARPPKSGPTGHHGSGSGLEARETLHKQFLSEENMATHFSRLSLHNDHPYWFFPVTGK